MCIRAFNEISRKVELQLIVQNHHLNRK